MERFLAILHELGATALADSATAALIGGAAVLVLVLLMLLGQSGGLRRLRKALEAERQSRAKLEQAVGGSGQKLEALRNEFGQYPERLAQLESDKQNQARRIDELSDKLNAQQSLHSQLEQRLAQADALLKGQNSQLAQYQALLDSIRQTNDARIAELGRQMQQLQQRLAAPQEPVQSPPLPVAAAEATPELEQNNAPTANLVEQPAEVEPPTLLPDDAGSETAAIPPQEKPAVSEAAPEPVPAAEPAREAPPIQAEEKPSPSDSQSTPFQSAPQAPTHAPEAGNPEKETVTKALLAFMADDLKKGTSQLKGLFKRSGKK